LQRLRAAGGGAVWHHARNKRKWSSSMLLDRLEGKRFKQRRKIGAKRPRAAAWPDLGWVGKPHGEDVVALVRHFVNRIRPPIRRQFQPWAHDKIFAIPAGQSCCSALNSRAAQQRRPTNDMENSAPSSRPAMPALAVLGRCGLLAVESDSSRSMERLFGAIVMER